MPKAICTLIVFCVAAMSFATLGAPKPRKKPQFEWELAIGKDKTHESIKAFQALHPKAACGRLWSMEINPKTMRKTRATDDIHCCLNDKDSFAAVSELRILNLDECAVHAAFYENQLTNLSYYVDLRSLAAAVPFFRKRFGPPDTALDPEDNPISSSDVQWWRDMDRLELSLAQLRGGDLTCNSPITDGEAWLTVVYVSLYTVDLPLAKEKE
jgi:hypothetical protein